MKVVPSRLRTTLVICIFSGFLVLYQSAVVSAQVKRKDFSPAAARTQPPGSTGSGYSIEGLNLVGADVTMPPFSDSILGTHTEFRRELYSRGFLMRAVSTNSYVQNTLNSPVPAEDQAYVGQRPFVKMELHPILTWDLRQLHLHGAQLNISAALEWVTWQKAGPTAGTFSSLYLYKSFGEDTVEVKAGYLKNNLDFVGLQVGGSVASGAQGVYAVLPYEVGLSHFPVSTPSLNIKVNGPKGFYEKVGFQRSIDPGGGPATIARNHVGLRFIPHGDKLLTITEVGYRRAASHDSHGTWVRGGYLHNSTPYPNSRTGGMTSGNYCAYFLADHQFRQVDPLRPREGYYAGFSAMTTPADMNDYTRYVELRVYKEGTFRSRPKDMVSLVASHSLHSKDTIRNLKAAGETFWNSSTSVTGSYSIRVRRGVYSSLGMSYVAGPAVTPRVPNALTFNMQWHVFF